MLIPGIIFVGSFIGIAVMIGMRVHIDHVRERELFQPIVDKARKVNLWMHDLMREGKIILSYCNKKTFLLLTHFLIAEAQRNINKFMNFIRKKLPPHK